MDNGCRYKRLCKFPSNGCLEEDEETCPKAKDLYANFCPLMAATDTDAKNCGCDIQPIRKLWPANKKCFEGQECLPRKHKTVQAQIGKITDVNSISASFATA